MILFLVAIAVPLLLAVAAIEWGTDSRDLSIDPRYPRTVGLR
jgi:hypothetical protein